MSPCQEPCRVLVGVSHGSCPVGLDLRGMKVLPELPSDTCYLRSPQITTCPSEREPPRQDCGALHVVAGPPLGEMHWGSLEKLAHFITVPCLPHRPLHFLERKNTHAGVFLLLLLNRTFSGGDGKMDLVLFACF